MDGMIPEGLLSPQQMEQLQQQRTSDFLLALGAGLAQTSQGMGRKPSTLSGITAALPGAVQAQRASIDQTLQQLMRAQQLQEMQRQREQRARAEAAQQRFAQQFAPMTPETALAAPGRVGPTAARAGMIGQTPALDRRALMSAILDPNLPAADKTAALEVFKATAPKETKMPASFEEFELAQTDPRYRQFLATRDAAKGTKVSVDMGKTFGGTLDKNLEAFFNNGASARGVLPTVQTMSALLDEGVRTGFGQETINKFNQAAQFFSPGYKVKEVAGQEAFIALSNEIILPQVKQLGVNPTDADLNFIIKGSPTLSKSVEGNRLLLNALNIKLQRDALLQEFATNWQNQNVDLIEQSPTRANAELRKQILNLTKTHPLWTESAQQLRQQYSQILGGGAPSMLQDSPFVTPSGPY